MREALEGSLRLWLLVSANCAERSVATFNARDQVLDDPAW